MKQPKNKKERLLAADDPLAINGYAGAYYEKYGIKKPDQDTAIERAREGVNRMVTLYAQNDTEFERFRALLAAATSHKLREAIHARGEWGRINLMQLDRLDLFLVLLTRVDPADILELPGAERSRLYSLNNN